MRYYSKLLRTTTSLIWFLTVPDLSAATQFFSSTPSGVHREKGQQSSEPRLSWSCMGEGWLGFWGARSCDCCQRRLPQQQPSSLTSVTSSSTTWVTTSTTSVLLPLYSMWFCPPGLVRIITLMFAIVVMIYLLLIWIKSHTKLLIYSTIQSKNLITGNLLRVVLLHFWSRLLLRGCNIKGGAPE